MENSNRPLLSICIPTYNRASVVSETIKRIVSDSDFDDEVELIISDNCSTDNTKEVVSYYVKEYSNVFYYRNNTNLRDENFSIVLSYGKGHYLKLQNDNLAFKKGSLLVLKSIIRKNLGKGIPIFFTGNTIYTKKKKDIIICNSLDEYVQVVSTFVTYISNFGAYDSDYNSIVDRNKYLKYLLQQDDWTYQIISRKGRCIVYDYDIYDIVSVSLGVREGYNWFLVHLDYYYKIMYPYVETDLISKETLTQDKKNLLKHFIPLFYKVYIYNYDPNWKFETKGTSKLLWKYYKKELFFYVYVIRFYLLVPLKFPYLLLKKYLKKNKFLYQKLKNGI